MNTFVKDKITVLGKYLNDSGDSKCSPAAIMTLQLGSQLSL